MAKVSVIVPNYNHASFLEERIESILDQTFQDFELILMDDCSTDNSVYVLNKYADNPKVSLILLNETNSGSPFKQWAKGILNARADLIWIAESDDFAHEQFLEEMVLSFNNEEMVLSYCDSYVVNEHSAVKEHHDFWKDRYGKGKWEDNYISDGAEEIEEALRYRCTIPNASAVVFKKSSEDVGFLNGLQMRYSGDWLFWIALLKRGKIAYNAQKLNYFRHHSQTTRDVKSYKTQYDLTKERMRIIKQVSSWSDRKKASAKLDWLIFHWLKETPRDSILKYLFPPFPLDLLLSFWWKLAKSVVYNRVNASNTTRRS